MVWVGNMVVDTEAVEQQFIGWLASLGEKNVRHELPPTVTSSDAPCDDCVQIYLLEFEAEPIPRGGKRPPLQAWMRYLLTVVGQDVAKRNQRMWKLLVAANQQQSDSRGEWMVEPKPLPLEGWRALGVQPRPNVVIRIRVQQAWDEKPAPLVRHPLLMSQVKNRPLRGVVRAPDKTPIPGAVVQLGATGAVAKTDTEGRFEFTTVSRGAEFPESLLVKAHGAEQTIPLPIVPVAAVVPSAGVGDDTGVLMKHSNDDEVEKPIEIILTI